MDSKVRSPANSLKDQTKDGSSSRGLHLSLFILFLISVIDLLGFTVILPLMPSIFEYYDSNKEDHFYHWMQRKIHYFQSIFGSPDDFNKVLFSGLLGSLYSGLQFLVAPIFGSLSDVYGRKPVVLLSMMGIGLSHVIWCFSDYFYLYVIARLVGGLSRTNITLFSAIVTDICSEKDRGKGMAVIGMAFAIGFLIGPMIGAFFGSHYSLSSENFYFQPALFAVSMAALDIIILLIFFKESLPKEKRAPSIGHGLQNAYKLISPFSLFSFSPVSNMKYAERKCLQQIGLTYFLFLFVYSGLEYSLSFLTHIRFGFSRLQQGRMYFFSGLIMIFVHGCVARRISPGKEDRSAIIGTSLIIPAFILIGISNNIYVLYTGLALYAFASATVVPSLTTIASKFGSHSQKGIVLGIFRSLGSLARAFGPMVFAVAYWSLSPTISYCLGAVLLIVPLFMIVFISKQLSSLSVKED